MTNGVLQATDVVKSYNKKEVLHSVSLNHSSQASLLASSDATARAKPRCSAF